MIDINTTKKKNYRSISLRNIGAKIVNTINQQTKFNNILEYIKKIQYTHNQGKYIPGTQGWLNTHKSINVIHNIKREG